MTPTASGMFPGSVEVAICDIRTFLTPGDASELACILLRANRPRYEAMAIALFQAASDADSFSPTAAALRIRKACEVGR